MKKFLFAVALLAGFSMKAHAVDASFDVGYSTYSIASIRCTTGTAVDVSAYGPLGSTYSLTGFTHAYYRFSNSSSVNNAFFGDSGVTVNNGETVISTVTPRFLEYKLGYNNIANSKLKIYCIGQASGGADGVPIVRAMFGY